MRPHVSFLFLLFVVSRIIVVCTIIRECPASVSQDFVIQTTSGLTSDAMAWPLAARLARGLLLACEGRLLLDSSFELIGGTFYLCMGIAGVQTSWESPHGCIGAAWLGRVR